MIGADAAIEMGIKFFRQEKLSNFVAGLKRGVCLDGIFADAVKFLGKKKTAELYRRLPKALKVYVLWNLDPHNNQKFNKKFIRIWDDYTDLHYRDRPDRCRKFSSYYRRAEKALLEYLGAK